MVSHAVWKTWPSGLSYDKNLGLRPRFLSTESLGPCFLHGTGDHDQLLQHVISNSSLGSCCEIAAWCMSQNLSDKKSTLVQVMAGWKVPETDTPSPIQEDKIWCVCFEKKINLAMQDGAVFNPLWPSDTIWWYRTGSPMAQVMTYCLAAPSCNKTMWILHGIYSAKNVFHNSH